MFLTSSLQSSQVMHAIKHVCVVLASGVVVYQAATNGPAANDDPLPWREAFDKAKEAAATEAE
eukprot:3357592-Pleurochrysis_carterae.AAC.1